MKMKKLVLAALVVSMVAFQVGCSSKESSDEVVADVSSENTEAVVEAEAEEAAETEVDFVVGDKIKEIQDKGVLVVGCDATYAPYSFIDTTSGETDPIGIDIEIAKVVAEKLGVELQLEPMLFNAVISALVTDKLDVVIDGVTPSDEQREAVDFTESYLLCEEGIVIRTDDAETYTTFDAFAGQKIAANIGSSEERFVKVCIPGAELLSLDKISTSMMELQAGNVAGVCMEKTVGQQYIDAYDNLTWSPVADDSFDSIKAIAVNKGNDDLLALMNQVIVECTEDGSIQEWLAHYSTVAAEMNAANSNK